MAAALDDSQSNIVRKAIALYESRLKKGPMERKVPRKVAEELEKASTAIRKKDRRWAMVSDVIEQASTSMEEFSPAVWGEEL